MALIHEIHGSASQILNLQNDIQKCGVLIELCHRPGRIVVVKHLIIFIQTGDRQITPLLILTRHDCGLVIGNVWQLAVMGMHVLL